MLQQTLYDSKFVKADARSAAAGEGCTLLTSTFDRVARIGDLYLRPGASLRLPPAATTGRCLLLPLAGEVTVLLEDGPLALQPGQLCSLPAAALSGLVVRNPFEEETVNLILLETNLPFSGASPRVSGLPLEAKNTLVAPDDPSLPLLLGLYDSRTKDRIELGAGDGISICYVLNGSFEIEERLLEYKDALLLWNSPSVEFEALSEAAIVLHLNLSNL